MTTDRLTDALSQTIVASGTPGLRVRPRAVALFFGVSVEQARRACWRLARRGVLREGRVA